MSDGLRQQKKANIKSKLRRALILTSFPQSVAWELMKLRTFDIVSALRPMEASGTLETLRKVKILVGQVFAYAVGTGLIDINPVLQIGRNTF